MRYHGSHLRDLFFQRRKTRSELKWKNFQRNIGNTDTSLKFTTATDKTKTFVLSVTLPFYHSTIVGPIVPRKYQRKVDAISHLNISVFRIIGVAQLFRNIYHHTKRVEWKTSNNIDHSVSIVRYTVKDVSLICRSERWSSTSLLVRIRSVLEAARELSRTYTDSF